MYLKIPKIVVGNDITGMVVAAREGATFIPVSYFSPFSWEYINIQFDWVVFNRNMLKLWKQNKYESELMKRRYYLFKTQDEEFIPKTYLFELEEMLIAFLGLSGQLWNDFSFTSCVHNDHTIKFNGKYDCLVVDFKEMIVVNPYNGFFSSESLEVQENKQSQMAHLLYHLRLNTEKIKDLKGLSVDYDLERINGSIFSKMWTNNPFGMKKFQFGFNHRAMVHTTTTINFVLFLENIPQEFKNLEEFDPYVLRKQIQQVFSPRSRRIKKKTFIFDQFIKKYCVSSEIDVYENTESIKFVYFEDKSEILCEDTLNINSWQGSFLSFLLNNTTLSIHSLLTNPLQVKFPR